MYPTAMKGCSRLIILVYFYCQQVNGSSHTNFVVKRFESCSKDNSTKFYSKITNQGGKQYLDFDITLPTAIDETIGAVAAIQSTPDGKTFIPLFTIREKNTCKAANSYLGEFWYDIERAAQFTPGVCPIPKRRYYAHNLQLDFSKITLQTFPFGTLRVNINLVDNTSRGKNSLFCLFIELENTFN